MSILDNFFKGQADAVVDELTADITAKILPQLEQYLDSAVFGKLIPLLQGQKWNVAGSVKLGSTEVDFQFSVDATAKG